MMTYHLYHHPTQQRFEYYHNHQLELVATGRIGRHDDGVTFHFTHHPYTMTLYDESPLFYLIKNEQKQIIRQYHRQLFILVSKQLWARFHKNKQAFTIYYRTQKIGQLTFQSFDQFILCLDEHHVTDECFALTYVLTHQLNLTHQNSYQSTPIFSNNQVISQAFEDDYNDDY